jgi:Flp pilus assembly CpaF family ATPase
MTPRAAGFKAWWRAPTALNLLKAWNTGHPGGCASIHANSAYGR